MTCRDPSAGLEEKNSDLSYVEVDEVVRLMCDVRPEIPANNAVPCRIVFSIELLFDVGRNVLLDVVPLQCLIGAVNCILLHIIRHVRVADHELSVPHLRRKAKTGRTGPRLPVQNMTTHDTPFVDEPSPTATAAGAVRIETATVSPWSTWTILGATELIPRQQGSQFYESICVRNDAAW